MFRYRLILKSGWSEKEGDYTIENSRRQTLYKAKTRSFLHRFIQVADSRGQVIASLEKVKSYYPAYELKIGGYVFDTAKTDTFFFLDSLTLKKHGWRITGTLSGLKFKVLDQRNREIGRIESPGLHMGPYYEIEYRDKNLELAMILITLCLICLKQIGFAPD